MDPLIGEIVSHYRIEREIGRGGMATVYLAEDQKHHRQVAIKVLTPEIAFAIGTDRFLREIEIAARLTHPHILPLHDSGAAGDHLYYVMPYIEGESLRVRLDREKQLQLEEAMRLICEIASGLGYAHSQGFVHRDIKPENILLADGLALIADFGLARATNASGTHALTSAAVMLGTPLYMSPEQAAGAIDVDGRSDLYALACVAFEILAGQAPFTGPTVESVIRQHLTVEPRSVTELRPSVPSGVAAAIAKGLSKIPADRHPTAARFVEALSMSVTSGSTPTPKPSGIEATIPNNLPKQLKSFVGRQRELAECSQLLGETRLLTLTGIGGCGKTRLALRLAENLLESYPDGVWFVDLAPVAEGTRVAQAVATVLRVHEEQGTPLAKTLSHNVASMRSLIVLDNCEHLLGEAGSVAEGLLQAGDNLRIVATSREGLGIEGEHLYAVRSMRTPSAEAMGDLKAVAATESVALFVDRARHVLRDFSLDERSTLTVAEICCHLDGIPLAIELAAARVEVLSVEQIRAKLSDTFQLLTGGSRALPRHQTFRGVMQWSYDHLDPQEQRLFRWLSVFVGGCTLEAATAVAGKEADEFGLLDLLARLVRKSLVQVDREAGGETRYRMLETVRQYALERLNARDEAAAARGRHLDYYLALVEEAHPRIFGPEQRVWLRRLERDLENVLSAQSWCDRAEGGAEKGLLMVGAVRTCWFNWGHTELGLRVTLGALGRSGAAALTRPRALALLAAGQLAYRRGAYGDARTLVEESLTVSRELGNRSGVCQALNVLGNALVAEKDHSAARRCHLEALALAREERDSHLIAGNLNALAELTRIEGELAEAALLYAECLLLDRQLGNFEGVTIGLLNLSMVAIGQGDLSSARKRLGEGLTLAKDIGAMDNIVFCVDAASGMSAVVGDWKRAARLHGVVEASFARSGDRRDPADGEFILPLIDRSRRELGEDAFGAEFRTGLATPFEDAVAETLGWLDISNEEMGAMQEGVRKG